MEFFVGDDGTVVFLEVNTRLQVEHPLGHPAITGVDLVEQNCWSPPARNVAIGAVRHRDQRAVESRVVAEDPRPELAAVNRHLDGLRSATGCGSTPG